MGDMNNILSKSEKSSSEKGALLSFEESQRELEASISKAVQLVSQKLSPEERISRYEVGLFSEPYSLEMMQSSGTLVFLLWYQIFP